MVESSKFAYLPETILLMTVEFVTIVGLFYYKYIYQVCRLDQNDSQQKKRFEDTYRSFSPLLTYVLFITRTLSLGYILGISVIMKDIIYTGGWYFFTNWNTTLISIYFLFSMSCSIVGFIYDDPQNILLNQTGNISISQENSSIWSSRVSYHSEFLLGLFSICGGTAILVTVCIFLYVNMYTYVYIHIQIYIYKYEYVWTCIYMYTCVFICIFMKTSNCIPTWACIYMIRIYKYVYRWSHLQS
jgi:hypothetical protein